MGDASRASGGRNRWRQASVGARGEMRRGGRGGGRSSRGEDRKGPEDLDCGLGLGKMKGAEGALSSGGGGGAGEDVGRWQRVEHSSLDVFS